MHVLIYLAGFVLWPALFAALAARLPGIKVRFVRGGLCGLAGVGVGSVMSRYDASTKVKAIRLVCEHRRDYPTEYAAITAVAGRLGMSPETLRLCVRQDEVNSGKAAGVTTEESKEVRDLKRKVAELEETIGILKAASGFFARDCDPRLR